MIKKKYIFSWIKRQFLKIPVFGKILLFYGVLILLGISISIFIYQKVYYSIVIKKVNSISEQTLQSMSINLESHLKTINKYSKMIIANENVQNLLRKSPGYSEPVLQRKVTRFINELMIHFPEMESIYIMDNYEHKYSSNDFIDINQNKDTLWFRHAQKLRGAAYFQLNGGDAFPGRKDKNFISLVRIINDLDFQNPIGSLIINVSLNSFSQLYNEIREKYGMDVIVCDEQHQIILKAQNAHFNEGTSRRKKYMGQFSGIYKIYENKYYISTFKIPHYNWMIISFMPFTGIEREIKKIKLLSFLIIVSVSSFIFVSTLFLSRMITRPIRQLTRSMEQNRKGELQTIYFQTLFKEFKSLQTGYNKMIREIKSLIRQNRKEQSMKRKAELHALQAQIKPHFLYNTLDSINSLAHMNEGEQVRRLITALGKYYRISLSKGREVITLKEEIEMVRNYLIIQEIRYKDLFEVHYDIQKEAGSTKILKLIMQPLVENAIYHGIKPLGECGQIRITVRKNTDSIDISIKDNGVGFSIDLLNTNNEKYQSFGLYGTIRRLQLFYNKQDIVSVRSERGAGTEVLIELPVV